MTAAQRSSDARFVFSAESDAYMSAYTSDVFGTAEDSGRKRKSEETLSAEESPRKKLSEHRPHGVTDSKVKTPAMETRN